MSNLLWSMMTGNEKLIGKQKTNILSIKCL